MTWLAFGLNQISNLLARFLLAPFAWLPGWLSLGLIGIVAGIAMLFVFKHTSHQAAIRRARNQIKANLLALSLFRESIAVSLRAQGRILAAAGQLILLSLVPMLVMFIPTCLLLSQLALWYQSRPLKTSEAAVVTVQLSAQVTETLRELQLEQSTGVKIVTGPVRVPAKRMICWDILVTEPGCRELVFAWGDKQFTKELVAGDGYLPTSLKRPGMVVCDVVMHPRESPFASNSPVQSILIAYPPRFSWTSGTKTWLAYWFLVSLIAAFLLRPLLNVNL